MGEFHRRLAIAEHPEWVWDRTQDYASEFATNISEAWKRRVRHNRQIERAALWYGVMLVAECKEALEPEWRGVLRPAGASLETTYELQSGFRFMRHALPYSEAELARLTPPEARAMHEFEFQNNAVDKRAGDHLLERWHVWLWPRGTAGRSPTTDDFGQAAVVVEGAQRLGAVAGRLAADL